jgi:trehalose 6-phosphate phosphatase
MAVEWLGERRAQIERLWLFLDYDGTLAEFAPTPDHVVPDPAVVSLLTRLARHPYLRVAVISGRRLNHVQILLPVTGVLLAGSYGIELQTFEGERIDRMNYSLVRPVLETLKPAWERLIAGRKGFFLEDKGWSLALHARFAGEEDARHVLGAARQDATGIASREPFRVMGGHRFLEISPEMAHKGQTVTYVLDHYPWLGAMLLYMGDDDKDEEAFGVIQAHGGFAVHVASRQLKTRADLRLESPQAARHWLATLADGLPLAFPR